MQFESVDLILIWEYAFFGQIHFDIQYSDLAGQDFRLIHCCSLPLRAQLIATFPFRGAKEMSRAVKDVLAPVTSESKRMGMVLLFLALWMLRIAESSVYWHVLVCVAHVPPSFSKSTSPTAEAVTSLQWTEGVTSGPAAPALILFGKKS